MRHDSDVILIGTGVAPLLAASRLLAEGRSVLILNPDSDFFLEDSEFPVDRLQPLSSASIPTAERFRRSSHEQTLELLRPDFPGAVELWLPEAESAPKASSAFHDSSAPHVRGRMRLWMARKSDIAEMDRLNAIEKAAQEAGMHPRRMDGIVALSKFPAHFLSNWGGGAPAVSGFVPAEWSGLGVPRVADVDVNRYRNGLLTYVRERLGPDHILTNVSDIDFLPDGGVRFHSKGVARTARYQSGYLIYWTPRLAHWISVQGKKRNWKLPQPRGLRLWEQWSLLSRFPVDPTVIGVLGDMLAWADVEGVPTVSEQNRVSAKLLQQEKNQMDEDRGAAGPVRTRLTVLRPSTLLESGTDLVSRARGAQDSRAGWLSSQSLQELETLCRAFLGWSRYSVRGLRTRITYEWSAKPPVVRLSEMGDGWLVAGVEGPLPKIAETVRRSVDRLISGTAPLPGEEFQS